MDGLYSVIDSTPIIDHHAHNLLQSSAIDEYDLLSITSEATGPALWHSTSSLAHIRAVKQLASVLGCDESWPAVQEALKLERAKPDDTWARRCFEGIETALIDDGLSPSDVHPYQWHDRLTRSKCKRIVRIERIAEALINDALSRYHDSGVILNPNEIIGDFSKAVSRALDDPEVVGFKSVICYRTGLAIPNDVDGLQSKAFDLLMGLIASGMPVTFARLEHEVLNPFFVHLTAIAIETSQTKKPFQFHTGLGDNDINLGLSNPSHLQPFIQHYPTVPIVLLHASYPFTTEAGYLASVYANVYLDIGEVFPMVSQSGQERIIQEALELCPVAKLMWSTDGHLFPETFLLAVMQVREGLKKVLGDLVRRDALKVAQAITIVEDILFQNSDELYQLDLVLPSISQKEPNAQLQDLDQLQHFSDANPSVKFLRLQWVDYTATVRVRVLPIKQAFRLYQENEYVGMTKAVLGLLQNDSVVPGFDGVGEYKLCPQYESLRRGAKENTATVQCEFREANGSNVPACPRTVLRNQIEKTTAYDLTLLIGSEIEVVFLSQDLLSDPPTYSPHPVNTGAHVWSSLRALHSPQILTLIESIVSTFEATGIDLQQYHPESAPGQYEFILSPLPPLRAIDTLLAARDVIATLAASTNPPLRATFSPKPFPNAAGTGAHIHISLTPPTQWQAFYAGVLTHLRAITALTYPTSASYERVADGVWAGGTWVSWGTQNRECPLRRIAGAHFEIKCVDGLANPYLALAAIVAAGVDGVVRKTMMKWGDCPRDPAQMDESERLQLGVEEKLPSSMSEALSALMADAGLANGLGYEVLRTHATVREKENRALLLGMESEERRRWLCERY